MTTSYGDAPGVVYRAFNGEGDLLYVGVTMNLGGRVASHAKDKPWWGDVSRITVEHFATRAEAGDAEVAAIAAESPAHNVRRLGVPMDAELREQRRLDRERRIRELPREYPTDRRVLCVNCGQRPRYLPVGVLVEELDCPLCECPSLELSLETKTDRQGVVALSNYDDAPAGVRGV